MLHLKAALHYQTQLYNSAVLDQLLWQYANFDITSNTDTVHAPFSSNSGYLTSSQSDHLSY